MFLNPTSFSNWSDLQTRLIPNWLIGGQRAPSAGCWLSLPHLYSNWSGLQTDWISCALSYIIVQHPPSSCGRHNFALIQPVHVQGYNILIDRMHLLFTLVNFLFWQPGRFVSQYTTLGSIPGRVIPKTQKMVLDASLFNTQHYKVRIKGEVE